MLATALSLNFFCRLLCCRMSSEGPLTEELISFWETTDLIWPLTGIEYLNWLLTKH